MFLFHNRVTTHLFLISSWTCGSALKLAHNVSGLSAFQNDWYPLKTFFGSFLASQCKWKACNNVPIVLRQLSQPKIWRKSQLKSLYWSVKSVFWKQSARNPVLLRGTAGLREAWDQFMAAFSERPSRGWVGLANYDCWYDSRQGQTCYEEWGESQHGYGEGGHNQQPQQLAPHNFRRGFYSRRDLDILYYLSHKLSLIKPRLTLKWGR